MDKRNWDWLPAQMPGVTRLVQERKKTLGAKHVNECFKRGVMLGEPGWFYAREGTLAVGTPLPDDPLMAKLSAVQITGTEVFLFMRGLTDGTNPVG